MADTMRRVALQEPMDPDEQAGADYCVANLSLYAVLNAAVALAEREGLTLKVDLKRPSPRNRRRPRG